MPKYNPLIFSGLDFTGSGGPAGAPQWKAPVDTEADLPMVANNPGDVRAVKDNQKLFVWDSVNSVWVDTTLTLAEFGSSPNSDAATLTEVLETVGSVDIYRRSFNLEPADEFNPGSISITTQTFSGDKTFKADIIAESAIDSQAGIDSSLGTLSLGTLTPIVDIGSNGALIAIHGPAEIDYTPADSGDWVVPPSLVIPALDELAQRTKDIEDGIIEHDELVKEPTGFPNRTDSSISFDDSSRTFTIEPTAVSFDVYIKGQKFTKIAPDLYTIPNLDGDHYIYYDNTGSLTSTQTFSSAIIQDNAFVAIVYWNTETGSHTYFAEERHGLVMDGATHSYLHRVFGSRYISGLALQGFTVDGSNPNDPANAQFTSDSGTIFDEDIVHQISAQLQIPILYRQGQLWRKKAADAFPLIYAGTVPGYAGSRVPYNQYTGGSWTLTQVQDSKFVLVHFFGTNDIDNPFVGIQGTNEYGSIEDARIGANAEISSLSGLPFAEFVPVGSVIFQTRDFYSNTARARVRSTDTGADYVDFRGSQLYTPAGTATTHGLLSGLSNDDHFQYLLADGTRPMSGALNMGSYKINSVADGTADDDAATVGQLIAATTGSPYTFTGYNDVGELSSIPGWVFDDVGAAQIGGQNQVVIPDGTTSFDTIVLSPTVSHTGLVTFSEININPQIDEPVTNYYGVSSYGYGTSSPESINSFVSQPTFSGVSTSITHVNLSGSTETGALVGVNYTPSSTSTTETAFNVGSSGDTGTFTGVQISPTGDSEAFNGIIISPSGTGVTYKGISIDGNATYDNATGLEITLSGIAATSRKIAITAEDGVITQNNTTLTTTSNYPSLVDSGNILRNVFTVESGSAITGTDVLLNNLAGEIAIQDDYSSSGLGLGIASVGFVAQVSVDSGKTADIVSMTSAGMAVSSESAGGSITEAHLYRGVGPLNFGGALSIDSMYGLKIEDGLSGFSTDAWGISVEDSGSENYLAKSLAIGTPTKKVADTDTGIEIYGPKTLKIGSATTAQRTGIADNSALLIFDSDNSHFYINNGANTNGWAPILSYMGDIPKTSFSFADNQSSAVDVDGFVFDSTVVATFTADVFVLRSSGSAQFNIQGVYISNSSDWFITQEYVGVDVGVSFSITASGQIQYTSSLLGSGGVIIFKATTV